MIAMPATASSARTSRDAARGSVDDRRLRWALTATEAATDDSLFSPPTPTPTLPQREKETRRASPTPTLPQREREKHPAANAPAVTPLRPAVAPTPLRPELVPLARPAAA